MAYSRINWENEPSTTTPLNETNLNKMDKAIYDLDQEMPTKADASALADKMDKNNPVGTGSFSMNRRPDTTVGNGSSTEGRNCTATKSFTHAEGDGTFATGYASHSEGVYSIASGEYSHAEGHSSTASSDCAHAEGSSTVASGAGSHAEGNLTEATGIISHAEGHYTIAASQCQHVQGKNNEPDTQNIYADIVGNGADEDHRSNCETTTWDGDKWVAGDYYHGPDNKKLADVDGIVNGSMKLVSGSTVLEKVPYNLRASGGKAGAVCQNTDKIVGGTIAWNQLLKVLSSTNWNNESNVTSSYSDGVATISSTTARNGIRQGVSFVSGHKYFIGCKAKCDSSLQVAIGNENILGTYTYTNIVGGNNWTEIADIKTATSTASQSVYIFATTVYTNLMIKDAMLVDLTQLMNDVISDATTFRSLFPNTYYAYNAGTLMSVNTSAHKMRNADDEVICDVALDSSLTLKGIYKLDANNDIYCDGDTYESDGTVTRNYGEVNLGSLTWYRESTSGAFYAYALDKKNGSLNIACAAYASLGVSFSFGNYATYPDKVIAGNAGNNILYIKDTAYSDAATLKTALNNVYAYVELATPTTETATAYTNPQIVDANGTEEYVDYAYSQNTRDVKVPVGHDSNYNQALELPAIPTGDGTYSLKCTRSGGSVSFSWV